MLTKRYPALRNRPFTRLLLANFVSGLGNSVNVITLSLLLYHLTGNVTALLGMWGTRIAARLVLQPIFGVMVDRSDKRHLLIVVQLLNALTALAFVLVDRDHLWLAFVLTFLLQCLDGLSGPALGATIPRLLREEELVSANALASLTSKVSGSLGPALAGIGFVTLGAAPLFVFNAVTFLAVLAAIWFLRVENPTRGVRATFWQDMLSGWNVSLAHPLVLTVLLLSAVNALAWRALEVVLVPWAQALPHLGASGYGLLFTALTLGGAAGALIVPRLPVQEKPAALLLGSFALTALPLAALAAWPVKFVVLAAMFTCGLLLDVVAVVTTSAIQRHVPSEYLGRVFATLNVALAVGALPVLIGLTPLVKAVGEGTTITLTGVLIAVSALTLSLGLRQRFLQSRVASPAMPGT